MVAVTESILFDASLSSDPDGYTLSFDWTPISDGTFDYDTLESPTYTAGMTAGIFDVTVTVFDSIESDSATTVVVVYDPDGGFVTGGWAD